MKKRSKVLLFMLVLLVVSALPIASSAASKTACKDGEHVWDEGVDEGFGLAISPEGAEITAGGTTTYTCKVCGTTKKVAGQLAVCIKKCSSRDKHESMDEGYTVVYKEEGDWYRICNEWYPKDCFYLVECPEDANGEHAWDEGVDEGFGLSGRTLIGGGTTTYTCGHCGQKKVVTGRVAICTASCWSRDRSETQEAEFGYVVIYKEEGNWYRICNKWYPKRCFYILDGENDLPIKGGQIRVTETTKVKPDEAWSQEISQESWPTVKAGTVRNAYRECGNWLEIKLNGKSYWIETAKTEELAAKGTKKTGQGILTVTATMYREARISAGVRGTLKEGTVVNIYEEKGEWVKILKNGVYAWIKADAVYNTATGAPKPADRIGQGTATQKMTIYEQPSTSSARVGSIPKGSVRNLYAQSGNWYQIYAGGKFAWVRCDGFDYTKSVCIRKIGTAMVRRGAQPAYYGPSLETESRDIMIPTYSKINVYAKKGTMYLVYRGGRFMWMSNQSLTQFRKL